MIHSLRLQNFQSHKDTKLEFSPGVNVIAGPSDSGKTAILRALHWLVNNRPSGDAFRSWWGGTTSVTLKTKKRKIVREKGSKSNQYQRGEEQYKAFGQDVPERISQALKFSPINTQFQMDAPFLLSLSPGEVAKQLNAVARLDVIDRALSSLTGMVRKAEGAAKGARDQCVRYALELRSFEHLDEHDAQLKSIEARHNKLTRMIEDRTLLIDIIHNLSSCDKALASLPEDVPDRTLVQLEKKIEALWAKKERIKELEQTITDHEKLMEELDNTKYRLKQHQATFNKLMPEVCPLCEQPIKR
jgi:exonuclease SbcC